MNNFYTYFPYKTADRYFGISRPHDNNNNNTNLTWAVVSYFRFVPGKTIYRARLATVVLSRRPRVHRGVNENVLLNRYARIIRSVNVTRKKKTNFHFRTYIYKYKVICFTRRKITPKRDYNRYDYYSYVGDDVSARSRLRHREITRENALAKNRLSKRRRHFRKRIERSKRTAFVAPTKCSFVTVSTAVVKTVGWIA